MTTPLDLHPCRYCGSADIRLCWISMDGQLSLPSAYCEACDFSVDIFRRYPSKEQLITAITKAWNERNPMYDFTLIRKTLKDVADVRRRTKEAYRIPHHTEEHQRAKAAIPVLYRDHARDWATALHIAYAEARGKTHCDAEAWLKSRWDYPRMLKNAKDLITERVVIPEIPVGSP